MAEITTRKFPEVQPGGSLMLAWQVKGKKVLVIGGGEASSFHVVFSVVLRRNECRVYIVKACCSDDFHRSRPGVY